MTFPHGTIEDSVPTVIHRGLNAETYFTLAETNQAQNLVDGLLYVAPPGNDLHEDIVLAVAEAVASYAEAHGGGKVVVERDCWLSEATVVQPDVAYLSPQRANLAGRFVRGAPDLVVEIVAPNTLMFDREVKFAAYASSDVREAWFVDIDAEATTVLIREGDAWRTHDAVPFGYVIQSDVLLGVGAAGLAPAAR